MPWYLYLALKQLFPTGRVFSFFTFMSALGVGVGVVLLVVSNSVMGGFSYEIKKMIVDTQGEIQVLSPTREVFPPGEVMAKVLAQPGVAAATPFTRGPVMLQYRNRPNWGSMLLGVDLKTVGSVVPFDRYLTAGSFEALDDDSIILSAQVARSLGATLGDQIDIYSPLLLQPRENQAVLPRTVRVVGIFQIGHQQLDSSLAIGTLRLMQELYDHGRNAQGLMVRLKPGEDEFKVAAALNAALPPGRSAVTWFELNADFQSIIKFEKNMIFFLLFFIVIVAALSIMSSLTIAVVRKTREIGLLGALGGRSRQVAACFCAQGFFLGVIGTIGGLGAAWLIIRFRDDIVQVLARATVGREVFEQFYGFAHLPSHTEARDVVVIVIGALVSATLAGLIPAWRAAKLKPVEALRSE
jgi:lipoprotein-releasing system permease protein